MSSGLKNVHKTLSIRFGRKHLLIILMGFLLIITPYSYNQAYGYSLDMSTVTYTPYPEPDNTQTTYIKATYKITSDYDVKLCNIYWKPSGGSWNTIPFTCIADGNYHTKTQSIGVRSPGTYYYYASVYGEWGPLGRFQALDESSSSASFYVADGSVAPSISNISPTSANQGAGVARTVSATVTDTNGDLDFVQLKYYKNGNPVDAYTKSMTPAGSTYSATINEDTSWGTQWTFRIYAIDATSKSTTSSSYTYTHNTDTTSPSVPIPTIYQNKWYTNPSGLQNEVTVTATDTASGFSAGSLKKFEVQTATCPACTYGDTLTFSSPDYVIANPIVSLEQIVPNLPFGMYARARAIVADAAGNTRTGSWSSGYYIYDNSDPHSDTPSLDAGIDPDNSGLTSWSVTLYDDEQSIVEAILQYYVGSGWVNSPYTMEESQVIDDLWEGDVPIRNFGETLKVRIYYRDTSSNWAYSPESPSYLIDDAISPVISDVSSTGFISTSDTEIGATVVDADNAFFSQLKYQVSDDGGSTWSGVTSLLMTQSKILQLDYHYYATIPTQDALDIVRWWIYSEDSSTRSNYATSSTTDSTVADEDAPVVVYTGSNPSPPVDGQSVTIYATITDEGQLAVVELRYCIPSDPDCIYFHHSTAMTNTGGDTWEATLIGLNYLEEYEFGIFAEDEFDNFILQYTSSHQVITYGDGIAPISGAGTGWITEPSTGFDGDFKFEITDGGIGVDATSIKFWFKINSGSRILATSYLIEGTTLAYTKYFTIPLSSGYSFDDTIYFWYTALDGSLNNYTSSVFSLTVDDTTAADITVIFNDEDWTGSDTIRNDIPLNVSIDVTVDTQVTMTKISYGFYDEVSAPSGEESGWIVSEWTNFDQSLDLYLPSMGTENIGKYLYMMFYVDELSGVETYSVTYRILILDGVKPYIDINAVSLTDYNDFPIQYPSETVTTKFIVPVTEEHSGVENIKMIYTINGGAPTIITDYEFGSDTYIFEIDHTNYAGTDELEYWYYVRDVASNEFTSGSTIVTVRDSAAPIVETFLINDVDRSSFTEIKSNSGTANVKATASDDSGLSGIYVRWDFGSSLPLKEDMTNEQLLDVNGFTIDNIDPLYIDLYLYVIIRAVDNSLLNGWSEIHEVAIIDGVAPQITTSVDDPMLYGIQSATGPFLDNFDDWVASSDNIYIFLFATDNKDSDFNLRSVPMWTIRYQINGGNILDGLAVVDSVNIPGGVGETTNVVGLQIGFISAIPGDTLTLIVNVRDSKFNWSPDWTQDYTLKDGDCPDILPDVSNPSGVIENNTLLTFGLDINDDSDLSYVRFYWQIRHTIFDPGTWLDRGYKDMVLQTQNGNDYYYDITLYDLPTHIEVRYWFEVADIYNAHTGIARDPVTGGTYHSIRTPIGVTTEVGLLEYRNHDGVYTIQINDGVATGDLIYFKILVFEKLFDILVPFDDDDIDYQEHDSDENIVVVLKYRLDQDPTIYNGTSVNCDTGEDIFSCFTIPAFAESDHNTLVDAWVEVSKIDDESFSEIMGTAFYVWDYVAPTITLDYAPPTISTYDGFTIDANAFDANGIYAFDWGVQAENWMTFNYKIIDGSSNVVWEQNFSRETILDIGSHVMTDGYPGIDRMYYGYTIRITGIAYDKTEVWNVAHDEIIHKPNYASVVLFEDTLLDSYDPIYNGYTLPLDNSMTSIIFNINADITDPESSLSIYQFRYNISTWSDWYDIITDLTIPEDLTDLYLMELEIEIYAEDTSGNFVFIEETLVVADGISAYLGSYSYSPQTEMQPFWVEFSVLDDNSGIDWTSQESVLIDIGMWGYVDKEDLIPDGVSTIIEYPDASNAAICLEDSETTTGYNWPCYPAHSGHGMTLLAPDNIYFDGENKLINASWNAPASLSWDNDNPLTWGAGTQLNVEIIVKDEGGLHSDILTIHPAGRMEDATIPVLNITDDLSPVANDVGKQIDIDYYDEWFNVLEGYIFYEIMNLTFEEDGYIPVQVLLNDMGFAYNGFYNFPALRYSTSVTWYIEVTDDLGNKVTSDVYWFNVTVDNLPPEIIGTISQTEGGNHQDVTVSLVTDDDGVGYDYGTLTWYNYLDNATWVPPYEVDTPEGWQTVPGHYEAGWVPHDVDISSSELNSTTYANWMRWDLQGVIPRQKYLSIGGFYSQINYNLTLVDKAGNSETYNGTSYAIEERLEPTLLYNTVYQYGDNIDETILRFGTTAFDEIWGDVPMDRVDFRYRIDNGSWVDRPSTNLQGDEGDWEMHREIKFQPFTPGLNITYSWLAFDQAGNMLNVTTFFFVHDRIAPLVQLTNSVEFGDDTTPVEILVEVKENQLMILNVTLRYDLDYSGNWISIPMINLTDIYQGFVPAQPVGTIIRWAVLAFDTNDPPSVGYIDGEYMTTDASAPLIEYLWSSYSIGQSFKVELDGNDTYVGYGYYVDPIIILTPETDVYFSGSVDSEYPVILNYTSYGMYMRLVEDDGDSYINKMNISIVVMESGRYKYGDMLIEAGKINVTGSATHAFEDTMLSPVVFTGVYDNNSLRTQLTGVNNENFTVQIENGSGMYPLQTELGYISISQGYHPGITVGTSISTDVASQVMVDAANTSVIMAQSITHSGDATVTFVGGLTSTSFDVSVQEIGSTDGVHGPEDVGYAVFSYGHILVNITEGEYLQIEANITDASTLVSVILEWSLDGENWHEVVMYSTIKDIYHTSNAMIPWEGIIEIRIIAKDRFGNESIKLIEIKGM